MILVLAGGGEARDFSALLEEEKIEHLCVFSTFAAAGNYGSGNAVVGRLDSGEMEMLLEREDVLGVVDLDSGNDTTLSRAAMTACKNKGIPYIKHLRLPVSWEELSGATATGSYRETVSIIEQLSGSVLLYTAPETAYALVKEVSQPERLYTPILRGISFDVELALEFGIPLANVLEMDGVSGEEAVSSAISKVGAKLLICDGTAGILEQLSAARKIQIPVVVTHRMGVEYSQTAWSSQQLMEAVRSWQKEKECGGKRWKP